MIRRHRRCAGQLVLLSVGLAVCASSALEEESPASEAPRRRIRRKYDRAVQLDSMDRPADIPKETKDTPREEPGVEMNLVNVLAPAKAPALPLPANALRLRPSEGEKKDDLWITMPAGTLLGVSIANTNIVDVGSWGWLSDDIRNSRATNRVERARDLSAEEWEDEDEETTAEHPRGLIQPVDAVSAPAPRRGLTNPEAMLESQRASLDASANRRALTLPTWLDENNVRFSAHENLGERSPVSEAMETPETPAFPGISRHMGEIAGSHQSLTTAPLAPADSRELLGTPLDTAATPPPSWKETITPATAPSRARPILSGEAENYGRRGDIFSPSFQTSSTEFPGASPPVSSFSMPAASPMPVERSWNAPPLSERALPTMNIRENFKPFDPAGRPLTNFGRGR